jgi:hypothetical protein
MPQLSTTTAGCIVCAAILCVSVAVAYGQYDDEYYDSGIVQDSEQGQEWVDTPQYFDESNQYADTTPYQETYQAWTDAEQMQEQYPEWTGYNAEQIYTEQPAQEWTDTAQYYNNFNEYTDTQQWGAYTDASVYPEEFQLWVDTDQYYNNFNEYTDTQQYPADAYQQWGAYTDASVYPEEQQPWIDTSEYQNTLNEYAVAAGVPDDFMSSGMQSPQAYVDALAYSNLGNSTRDSSSGVGQYPFDMQYEAFEQPVSMHMVLGASETIPDTVTMASLPATDNTLQWFSGETGARLDIPQTVVPTQELQWFSPDGARQSQDNMQQRPSEELVWFSPEVTQTQPIIGEDTAQLAYYRNLALQAHAETHPSVRLGDESGIGEVNAHEIAVHAPPVYSSDGESLNIHTSPHEESSGIAEGSVGHIDGHGDGTMLGYGGASFDSNINHEAHNQWTEDNHSFHPSDGLPGMIGMDHTGHAYFSNTDEYGGSHAAHSLLAFSHDGNHFDGDMGHDVLGFDHAGHSSVGQSDEHGGHSMSGIDHGSHDMDAGHSGHDSAGGDHSGHDLGGGDHSGHDISGDHGGHDMSSADHSGHDMGGSDHSGHDMSASGDHSGHDMSTADHSGHSMGSADHSGHAATSTDHSGHTTASHAEHSATSGSHANHDSTQNHSSHTTTTTGHAGHSTSTQNHQAHTQTAQHSEHSTAMQMSGGGGDHAMHKSSAQQTLEHGGGTHSDMFTQDHAQHVATLSAPHVHDSQTMQHVMESAGSAQHQHVEIPGIGSYSVLAHEHSGEAAGGKSPTELQEHTHPREIKKSFNQQKNLVYILFMLGGIGSMFILVGRMLFPQRRIIVQRSHYSR